MPFPVFGRLSSVALKSRAEGAVDERKGVPCAGDGALLPRVGVSVLVPGASGRELGSPKSQTCASELVVLGRRQGSAHSSQCVVEGASALPVGIGWGERDREGGRVCGTDALEQGWNNGDPMSISIWGRSRRCGWGTSDGRRERVRRLEGESGDSHLGFDVQATCVGVGGGLCLLALVLLDTYDIVSIPHVPFLVPEDHEATGHCVRRELKSGLSCASLVCASAARSHAHLTRPGQSRSDQTSRLVLLGSPHAPPRLPRLQRRTVYATTTTTTTTLKASIPARLRPHSGGNSREPHSLSASRTAAFDREGRPGLGGTGRVPRVRLVVAAGLTLAKAGGAGGLRARAGLPEGPKGPQGM